MKRIKSSDPRKSAIVRALKDITGATKVTDVEEIEPGVFAGRCLSYVPEVKRYELVANHIIRLSAEELAQ